MLFKLLAAPLTAPLNSVYWLSQKIDEAAQAQLNDTEELKRQLMALELKLENGDLTEDEFEELELDLVRRLQAANQRLQAAAP